MDAAPSQMDAVDFTGVWSIANVGYTPPPVLKLDSNTALPSETAARKRILQPQ